MTPPSMTRQALYDFFIQGIRDGVYPGYDRRAGVCEYDLGNGRHCFIGHLGQLCGGLQFRERCGIQDQPEAVMVRLEQLTGLDLQDLKSLQVIHDTVALSRDGWDPVKVVARLNRHPAFGGLVHVDPDEFKKEESE